MTAIASLLAGGEFVDDVNALRAGRMSAEILGVAPAAASTVGTFLRAFTPGHARRGRHLGEFDQVTGRQTQPANPSRKVDP